MAYRTKIISDFHLLNANMVSIVHEDVVGALLNDIRIVYCT